MHDFAIRYFGKKRYDKPKNESYEYDLDILVQDQDPAPPRNQKALRKFAELAEKMNFYFEFVSLKDLSRLWELNWR